MDQQLRQEKARLGAAYLSKTLPVTPVVGEALSANKYKLLKTLLGRWRLGHISIWAAADHRLFADVYGPVHNVQTAEIFLSQPAVDKGRWMEATGVDVEHITTLDVNPTGYVAEVAFESSRGGQLHEQLLRDVAAQSTAKVDRIDMLDHIVIHVRGKLTGVAFACFLLETLRDFTSKGKVVRIRALGHVRDPPSVLALPSAPPTRSSPPRDPTGGGERPSVPPPSASPPPVSQGDWQASESDLRGQQAGRKRRRGEEVVQEVQVKVEIH